MSHLVVVGFKDNRYKANDVLNDLRQLNDEYMVTLDDAVAVYRGYDGELRIDQSYDLTTGEGAGWGALWGALIGAVIAIPFTGGASAVAVAPALAAGLVGGGAVGAATGAISANWWKEDFGLSEDFVYDVAAVLRPGDSAIFAIFQANPDRLARQFEGEGGTVLMTTLSSDQEARIQEVLDGWR